MNRRQLFLSPAKAALLSAFGGTWLSGKASAQVGNSTPTAILGEADRIRTEGVARKVRHGERLGDSGKFSDFLQMEPQSVSGNRLRFGQRLVLKPIEIIV
jgi:hypothetical protein